jgi:hypothetical protein
LQTSQSEIKQLLAFLVDGCFCFCGSIRKLLAEVAKWCCEVTNFAEREQEHDACLASKYRLLLNSYLLIAHYILNTLKIIFRNNHL